MKGDLEREEVNHASPTLRDERCTAAPVIRVYKDYVTTRKEIGYREKKRSKREKGLLAWREGE